MKQINDIADGIQSSVDSFIVSTLVGVITPTMFAIGIFEGLIFLLSAILFEAYMFWSTIKDVLANGIFLFIGMVLGMFMLGEIGQLIVLVSAVFFSKGSALAEILIGL